MSLFIIDPESPSRVALRETGEHVVRRDDAGYYVYHSAGVTYLMHRVVFELTHGFCPEASTTRTGTRATTTRTTYDQPRTRPTSGTWARPSTTPAGSRA